MKRRIRTRWLRTLVVLSTLAAAVAILRGRAIAADETTHADRVHPRT